MYHDVFCLREVHQKVVEVTRTYFFKKTHKLTQTPKTICVCENFKCRHDAVNMIDVPAVYTLFFISNGFFQMLLSEIQNSLKLALPYLTKRCLKC